jgi:hypothetical protein
MNRFLKIASIITSGLLIIFLNSRFYWLNLGTTANGLLIFLFGLTYWFVVLCTLVNLIYLIYHFKKQKTTVMILLIINAVSLTIYWVDFDFSEINKSKTLIVAEHYRSEDDRIILKLRKDSSFEIFQSNNMLSSHSFNYGKYSINNDTIYLHFEKEVAWGKFKNRKLGKLVLLNTTESLYNNGYIEYLKDSQTDNKELDYYRFEIVEKENTCP